MAKGKQKSKVAVADEVRMVYAQPLSALGLPAHYTDSMGEIHPAIITRVHNKNLVNLRVFVDGLQEDYSVAQVKFDEDQSKPKTWRPPFYTKEIT